jgi:hypothetical protein
MAAAAVAAVALPPDVDRKLSEPVKKEFETRVHRCMYFGSAIKSAHDRGYFPGGGRQCCGPIDCGAVHNATATTRGSPWSTDGDEWRHQIISDRSVRVSRAARLSAPPPARDRAYRPRSARQIRYTPFMAPASGAKKRCGPSLMPVVKPRQNVAIASCPITVAPLRVCRSVSRERCSSFSLLVPIVCFSDKEGGHVHPVIARTFGGLSSQ